MTPQSARGVLSDRILSCCRCRSITQLKAQGPSRTCNESKAEEEEEEDEEEEEEVAEVGSRCASRVPGSVSC